MILPKRQTFIYFPPRIIQLTDVPRLNAMSRAVQEYMDTGIVELLTEEDLKQAQAIVNFSRKF